MSGWSFSGDADVAFEFGGDGPARRVHSRRAAHQEDVWLSSGENPEVWPRWLSEDIPGLAVWSIEHDSAPSLWHGHAMPLVDRANNILPWLLQEKRLAQGDITFVAHSFGGLILEELLRSASDRSTGKVSAVTRSKALADEVRVLSRAARRRAGSSLSPEAVARIALVAAAANAEFDAWGNFVGDWLAELAFADMSREQAIALQGDLNALLHIEPLLWETCGRAEAALSAFVESFPDDSAESDGS